MVSTCMFTLSYSNGTNGGMTEHNSGNISVIQFAIRLIIIKTAGQPPASSNGNCSVVKRVMSNITSNPYTCTRCKKLVACNITKGIYVLCTGILELIYLNKTRALLFHTLRCILVLYYIANLQYCTYDSIQSQVDNISISSNGPQQAIHISKCLCLPSIFSWYY